MQILINLSSFYNHSRKLKKIISKVSHHSEEQDSHGNHRNMTVAKNDVSLIQRTLWVCNTIFHQAVALVTVFVFWIFIKNFPLDNPLLWHIILSTGAYVPLMAEGIIVFAGDNVWSQRLDRTKKYWIHGVLLGTSIIAVTVGISLEIDRKNAAGRDHFVSDHAITGLVSWLLAMLGIFLGLFSWHAQSLSSIGRPVIFKFVHNFLGIASYVIGIASLCLGLYLPTFGNLVTDTEQDVTVGLVGFITGWSLLAAFVSGYNQCKTMFS